MEAVGLGYGPCAGVAIPLSTRSLGTCGITAQPVLWMMQDLVHQRSLFSESEACGPDNGLNPHLPEHLRLKRTLCHKPPTPYTPKLEIKTLKPPKPQTPAHQSSRQHNYNQQIKSLKSKTPILNFAPISEAPNRIMPYSTR